MQRIAQEAASRGLLGIAGNNPQAGMGIAGARMMEPQQQGFGSRLLDAGLTVIPKVGVFWRGIQAGPTADGTLDHARSMGWLQ